MLTLSANSNDYYYLTQQRGKYTRNSKKYYACTQLIKINKLERKLILEEQNINNQMDKMNAKVERFKSSKRTKLQIIEALTEDVAGLQQ
jgi:hypothetical protein